MKNQNLFLTGILTIAISCPAFATGIGASDTTADCDNSTLGTYEGSTNLQAQWTANRITLNWYNDSTENNGTAINVTGTNAASCVYDSSITLPTQPSKTGYEFSGWRVRTAAAPSQPQQTTFDLSTLAQYIEIGGDGYGYQNDSTKRYGPDSDNTETYGITGDQQWATEFEYGTVKGEAVCSTQYPETFWYDNDNIFTSDHFATTLTDDPEEEKRYCWCKPTGFDAEKEGTYLNVSSFSWVFNYGFNFDPDDADNCAYYCAASCADYVSNRVGFRRAVFGVTE